MKKTSCKIQLLHSLFGLLLSVLSYGTASAQLHLKAHLQNMHLWRGMEVTDGFVLTTDLSVTDRNGHFRAGVWGGVNMNGSYKEFNHYVSYTYRCLSMAIWDTYNFSPGAPYNNREYFNYKARETGRFIDATLSYTGSGKLPLSVSWSTIVYGRDRDERNARQRYSTFVYTEYPVYNKGAWEVKPGIGAAFAFTPGKDIQGESTTAHFYGDTAGIVHISLTTTYRLTAFKHSFPLTVMGLWNPQSSKGYLQIGIQLLSL